MSAKNRAEKLKTLIGDSYGSNENPWITRSDIEDAIPDSGDDEEILHWIRYGSPTNNRESADRIDGFERLLRNFETNRKGKLVVHKVFDEIGRLYRVFTDSEITELIGILRFPIQGSPETHSARVKKLRQLITNTYGSGVNPWISMLEAVSDVEDGRIISVFAARDIFTRRSMHNEKRGRPIDGFEHLLTSLETTPTKEILIHRMFDDNKREFAVFTNTEIDELIGLLRFPL